MIELESCIRFLQNLIQIKSLPGQEEKIARLVFNQMVQLGYDDCRVDEAGNVIGLFKGTGQVPPLNFNTHLDHVDVGEEESWPFPPFSGFQDKGKIWGRGAVDIKGPLASQVYAIGSLIRAKNRPPGDIYVTSVVQEEVGGVGACYLASHLKTPFVIVGEPSKNQIKLGHRGRVELVITFRGKSSHASMPHLACNPLYSAAAFINLLKNLPMSSDPTLGMSTVVPTILKTDQTSSNVIPSEVKITCDWRSVAGETSQHIAGKLSDLANQSIQDGISCSVEIPSSQKKTYTGLELPSVSEHPSFALASNDPLVQSAFSILNYTIGPREKPDVWRFATDGGHFYQAGQKVIGFGPGDDRLAHTIDESIEITAIKEAIIGYRSLALGLLRD